MGDHGESRGEERYTVRVKCLAQEHNTLTPTVRCGIQWSVIETNGKEAGSIFKMNKHCTHGNSI